LDESMREQFNPSERTKLKAEQEKKLLTEEDWDMLVGGTKLKTFKKGECIIKQGKQYQKLCQIVQGRCRVEKEVDGKKTILSVLVTPETFGETSFTLWDKGSSVSIIAEEDVALSVIEGYFIKITCDMKNGFAGRFYNYLAATLARRVYSAERMVYNY